jgi:chaperone modulatory protein CbpM
MITIQALCESIPGLTEPVLLHYLAQDWIRPAHRRGTPEFAEIDVARIRLILELHTELEVDEPTLPLILSLLDQLHATRRQLRLVLDALDEPVRATLAERLAPRR